ncbi:MAG: hypothetical protein KOO60_05505 [Gemmatimonadales bacterium]|nr:hypothetical protein [Gemmatimonadales bacterium]
MSKKTPAGWHPPFCPNANCKFHKSLLDDWCYIKFSTYLRKSDNRRIQRYRCLSCKRTFSTQTFSTTYWQKIRGVDAKIFTKTIGGMANRQIARDLGIDPTTVNHKLERLGRHCLLYFTQIMMKAPPSRKIVFDGFETFELSQFFPFHHNVAVEKDTDLILFFNDSELRRKGRMTDHQKRRRTELEHKFGRPNPRAIEIAVAELLSVVIRDEEPVEMFTDDHPQYRIPIRSYGDQIKHFVTSSRDHRDRQNSLWEVNLFDFVLRHSSANHKRETIAWSKRRQSSTDRLAIFVVWRNFMKGRREKDRRSPTPAEARGLLARRLKVEDVLSERLFPGHYEIPVSWQAYYWRLVSTRALERERRHTLKYAA